MYMRLIKAIKHLLKKTLHVIDKHFAKHRFHAHKAMLKRELSLLHYAKLALFLTM